MSRRSAINAASTDWGYLSGPVNHRERDQLLLHDRAGIRMATPSAHIESVERCGRRLVATGGPLASPGADRAILVRYSFLY